MLTAGHVYENERTGTRFAVAEATPESLRFRRTYPPGTGKADAHVHLDFVQQWTVVEGRGRLKLDGTERDANPGETVRVERETGHQDIHNPFDEPLLVDWLLEPCNEFVENFADAYVWLLERGKLNDQEEFRNLQLFAILDATSANSYVLGPPRALQRAAIPLMARFARMRGYRPHYE